MLVVLVWAKSEGEDGEESQMAEQHQEYQWKTCPIWHTFLLGIKQNTCDCLELKLENYTSSPPSIAASFLYRLGSKSSGLWLCLCGCAVVGTPSHRCACFCLVHTRKSHSEWGKNYCIVPASFCRTGVCKHQKCPPAKWCNCFFLYSFNAVLYCIFLVMIKSMTFKWITVSLWVLKGLFEKKKKKFAAALQKTCELIWVPAYECCIKISKQTAAIAKNR